MKLEHLFVITLLVYKIFIKTTFNFLIEEIVPLKFENVIILDPYVEINLSKLMKTTLSLNDIAFSLYTNSNNLDNIIITHRNLIKNVGIYRDASENLININLLNAGWYSNHNLIKSNNLWESMRMLRLLHKNLQQLNIII